MAGLAGASVVLVLGTSLLHLGLRAWQSGEIQTALVAAETLAEVDVFDLAFEGIEMSLED